MVSEMEYTVWIEIDINGIKNKWYGMKWNSIEITDGCWSEMDINGVKINEMEINKISWNELIDKS